MKSLNNADVHASLLKIAKITYPDREIPKFFIKMVNEERRTFHGYWTYPKKNKWGKMNNSTIKIFNLTRPTQYVICCAVHELAHHCDYMLRGDTDHSKEFYKVYGQLMETAIKLSIIDFPVVKEATDVRDIRQLLRYVKEVDNFTASENMDNKIMKIGLSFGEGSALKQKDFIYSTIEKCWTKEAHIDIIKEDFKKIKEFLSKTYSVEQLKNLIRVSDKLDVDFQVHKTIYIRIPETNGEKNMILKNDGVYKYNKVKNYWSKSMSVDDMNQEINRLRKIGIDEAFFY